MVITQDVREELLIRNEEVIEIPRRVRVTSVAIEKSKRELYNNVRQESSVKKEEVADNLIKFEILEKMKKIAEREGAKEAVNVEEKRRCEGLQSLSEKAIIGLNAEGRLAGRGKMEILLDRAGL
jgi:hypothetical protein